MLKRESMINLKTVIKWYINLFFNKKNVKKQILTKQKVKKNLFQFIQMI